MSKVRMLNSGAPGVIRCNMNEIEKHLGHPIPPEYIDATKYGDRIITSAEAGTIAHNIREIERARRFDSPRPKPTVDPDNSILTFVVMVILIIVAYIAEFFGLI